MNALTPTSDTCALAKAPDIMSGNARDREARGRALAQKFHEGTRVVVKFIAELKEDIVEVRQDFAVKPQNELICGVATFTEYCSVVLGYSLRHIERILEGNNPALSPEENKAALHRKAKRELNAKVAREKSLSPMRPKSNEEIVAEAEAEHTTEALLERVAELEKQVQIAKPSPVAINHQEQDIQKIHANEIQRLEDEIVKLQGKLEKVNAAYTSLRRDAIRLGNAVVKAKTLDVVQKQAQDFLVKHGDVADGGAL